MSPTHAPQARRSPEEQARLEDRLRHTFEQRIPFNAVLGLKVHSFDPSKPQLLFTMRKELVGNFVQGRLHGGVTAAVLDTVGGFAVGLGIAEKYCDESAEEVGHRFNRVGTIDLRTDFLRPGLGKHFIATGKIIRLGGRIASVHMSLEDDAGHLIATGAGAYVVS